MNLSEKELSEEIAKRRTFAIISHPDAGKTTLTEKLLLYSGAIHVAGMVQGQKGRKAAVSDWMALEQERGISITSSVMQFVYKGRIINVLDTPGHEDFSEDTYRTLTAADCAIMVIDAAKGVEKQTRKLFEVCHLRKIPVLTFINKMDMPGRNPFDLMNEVEEVLKIQSVAMNWPLGSGRQFMGVYDRAKACALTFSKTSTGGAQKADIRESPLEEVRELLPPDEWAQLLHDIELLQVAGNTFDREKFLQGKLTPVFFASALTNFGIEPFFDAFVNLAPSPTSRMADLIKGGEVLVEPTAPFSAYVFKIQANMNKKHRDSTAFMRICSGQFEKDMVVSHHRLNREIRLSRPHGLVAGERSTIDVAYAGDVIGVINPGLFAVGDTVSLKKEFNFKPLPQFQPEIFAEVTVTDVGRRKSFDKGMMQLAEEGTVQVLHSRAFHADKIMAAVGKLQFEVMQFRLQDEYGVETRLRLLPYKCSGWILGNIDAFRLPSSAMLVVDRNDRVMALFSSQWEKDYAIKQNPDHQIVDIIV